MTGILTKLLLVMIGGSLGALCRYGVSLAAIRLFGTGLSWGTFTANMIGCFFIGILFALADRWAALTPPVRLFLMTGFLGALTTFSTYALETVDAARSGRLAEAALTVAANNLGGIVLVMTGITVVQILYRGGDRMSLDYRVIEIYTSEEARHDKRPVADGVVEMVKSLKAAARCITVVGRAGAYESGEIASKSLLTISYNLPVKIEIILPATELEKALSRLETIVEDGIVAVREVSVRSYRTRHQLIPRQIRIKDIMTRNPVAVTGNSPLDEVASVLLSAVFGGVPVVDAHGRPEGMITQGDLIYKAGMPLRIGLVAASEPEQRSRIMGQLATRRAEAVMTPSPICIEETQGVAAAANKMLRHRVKRLPVVDDHGRLVGMISRVDIFQTIAREAPDWSALAREQVAVDRLKYVSDIMRRDTQTVGPETPVEEVIRIITADDIQRVAVVGGDGGFSA